MDQTLFKEKIDTTLICLIRGMIGRKTTVELRNENKIIGTIDGVDCYMNIDMSDATLTDIFGSQSQYEKFFAKGTNIRYVHIPSDISITKMLEQEVKILNRKEGFKETRKMYQKIESKNKLKSKVNEKVNLMKDSLGL